MIISCNNNWANYVNITVAKCSLSSIIILKCSLLYNFDQKISKFIILHHWVTHLGKGLLSNIWVSYMVTILDRLASQNGLMISTFEW